ncbi:uncharacterized protein LOC110821064 isoform X2 [Carica papaya]|uniref:uncharacterized protein LOC110821064 isoform X2 n=2 Tax=Carica papaya TaxID=3649 RepID=UPI000B8C89D3|nr:uncharacterized protein LOC110821064 isoform X2 [Carica papaya]
MTAESKSGVVKLKSSGQDGSSKGKGDSSLKEKNLIRSSIKQQPADPKVKSVSTVTIKTEVKSKTTPSSSKTTTTTTKVKEKREKKVYSLPGQKYDPPEEREPLRIFYESLSKQIPESEMAEFCT